MKFMKKWPRNSEDFPEAFRILCGHEAQLLDDLLLMCSGFTSKEQFQIGLTTLEEMCKNLSTGKNSREVILEMGEFIKAENEFMGAEFLENCQDILNGESKTGPVEDLISAAHMFQVYTYWACVFMERNKAS